MEYIEPNSERWLSLEDLPSEEWRDIERELGYLHGNLVSCCKGRYKQAYGYIWRYFKEEDNE